MGLCLFIYFYSRSLSISYYILRCFSYSYLEAASASFFSGLLYNLDIIFYLCCFHFYMPEPARLYMSSYFYSAGALYAGRPPFFCPAFQYKAIELWATLPLSSSTPFFPINFKYYTNDVSYINILIKTNKPLSPYSLIIFIAERICAFSTLKICKINRIIIDNDEELIVGATHHLDCQWTERSVSVAGD